MADLRKPRRRATNSRSMVEDQAQVSEEPLVEASRQIMDRDRGKRPWLLFSMNFVGQSYIFFDITHRSSTIAEWQKDNEYMLTSYRPASHSFLISFKSLFGIHNETVNIHSHLFGSALFALLPINVYLTLLPRRPSALPGDKFVFFTFFFGVALCFFLSAVFHILANHSDHVRRSWNQLDYLRVVLLMWDSTIPSVYYGFYCDPTLQKVYWTVVSVLAASCVYATLHPMFRHRTYRPYRAAMYAGLGLSALAFITHGLIIHGWNLQNNRMQLMWMAVMGAFNLVGAGTYAARVPERWYPVRFDVVGGSHQILHCSVILAGIAHYIGLVRAFDFVHSGEAPCPVR